MYSYFFIHFKYFPKAIKIMKNAISKFGSYESYMEETGGRKISRYEITQAARRYLQQEGMESEVDIHLSEDLLSRYTADHIICALHHLYVVRMSELY